MTDERKQALTMCMHTSNAVSAAMAMMSAVLGICVATGDEAGLSSEFDVAKIRECKALIDNVLEVAQATPEGA